jgi:hypothetical protein
MLEDYQACIAIDIVEAIDSICGITSQNEFVDAVDKLLPLIRIFMWDLLLPESGTHIAFSPKGGEV